ncbi:peroxiredoxin (alkyl hydroperoxide reductase subunit C) [Pseudomonas delhiensis]|uniref:Thioredoxin peroxidase n=2 Tax=Pseudomonas TaxID=286 RepID=A0A239K9A9_9PSED|nr:peroxiredoxin [Pseudomonas sp. JH-2]PWU26403.1 peroxiredoxin [Pseudomonas sp. RW407]SDJ34261.1 peroxiredoxin (alkyl hydroperoxide reductase subunit C) [Pseudomonas delhiensis]SNT14252.1 1-Cys peroxiredoxin [Pseudomonas delhiensis]
MPPLRQNDRAPEFRARTTRGDVALSDYRGRWLLLFSHPADFTPVCTSEFIAFARAKPRFDELGCELLALSVDGLYSHLAWIRDIHERFGVAIDFPIIEDPSMAIARGYGMVAPDAVDSSTTRVSYVIDPEGIIRALSWYPMNVGRSVEELLRLVAALQATDRHAASTPEGWQPGGALLEPVALDAHEALQVEPGPDETWYYRWKKP